MDRIVSSKISQSMDRQIIKVSIIVPVFNTAGWVSRCIESLLTQTLQDIEIILVDDASTDNSLDILRKYEQRYPQKIQVIHSKENLRQGGARNLGIKAARGEYLGFVDSDDWVDKEMYENLYSTATEANSDMCYCYYRKVSNTNTISNYDRSYSLPIGTITDKIRREMLINHITRICSYIYKRSLFIENNIRFPEHLRYEDMMIDPLVLLYASRVSAVKQSLYNYFIHSNSTMTSLNDTKYLDKLKVCKMIVEEYKKRGFYDQYKNEINYLFFRKGYIHSAINYLLNTNSPQQKIITEIRRYLLSMDHDYHKNPYYPGKLSFRIIDYLLNIPCNVILKILRLAFKITHYNV